MASGLAAAEKENDVVYEVLAYRKLTKEEVKRAVRQALAKKKGMIKPGETYTIMTVIS
jgi:tRNA(Ile2) C34 agmatinyltransferase TiaS